MRERDECDGACEHLRGSRSEAAGVATDVLADGSHHADDDHRSRTLGRPRARRGDRGAAAWPAGDRESTVAPEREIADQLVLSRRTLDLHLSAVLRKLPARTPVEAAATLGLLGTYR